MGVGIEKGSSFNSCVPEELNHSALRMLATPAEHRLKTSTRGKPCGHHATYTQCLRQRQGSEEHWSLETGKGFEGLGRDCGKGEDEGGRWEYLAGNGKKAGGCS